MEGWKIEMLSLDETRERVILSKGEHSLLVYNNKVNVNIEFETLLNAFGDSLRGGSNEMWNLTNALIEFKHYTIVDFKNTLLKFNSMNFLPYFEFDVNKLSEMYLETEPYTPLIGDVKENNVTNVVDELLYAGFYNTLSSNIINDRSINWNKYITIMEAVNYIIPILNKL